MDQVVDPAIDISTRLNKDQIQDPESASKKRPLSSKQDQVPCKKSMLDRFDITEKDKTNSWEIKQVLADYATKQMNTYIPESDIKDEILYTYPIPDNIKNKKEIDKSLLLEQRSNCLLYTSPSPRDGLLSRMPSSA